MNGILLLHFGHCKGIAFSKLTTKMHDLFSFHNDNVVLFHWYDYDYDIIED